MDKKRKMGGARKIKGAPKMGKGRKILSKVYSQKSNTSCKLGHWSVSNQRDRKLQVVLTSYVGCKKSIISLYLVEATKIHLTTPVTVALEKRSFHD